MTRNEFNRLTIGSIVKAYGSPYQVREFVHGTVVRVNIPYGEVLTGEYNVVGDDQWVFCKYSALNEII